MAYTTESPVAVAAGPVVGHVRPAWVSLDDDPAIEPSGPLLLVGTRKGLWILAADESRSRWAMAGPMFLGHIIHHAVLDPRDRRTLLVSASTGHLGPTIFRSQDLGASWAEVQRPPAFAGDDNLERTLRHSFWLTPGHPSRPGGWYAGGSPQGLFASEDDGDNWHEVSGWNHHPRFAEWCEWPEQGTPNGSMLHSVIVHPGDPDHLYIGLSSGGVFESLDGGRDWRPLNGGVAADFLPDADPEFGHDPHCVRIHPANPDRLYQQNHCGIYRIDRPSERWIRIGDNMPREVGDIGFPIEVHPTDPDTAWVIPMDGTDVWPRTSPGGQPAVYVTHDGGESWERQDTGLPERGWLTVKRQAMCSDGHSPLGLYFGTTGGEVWASSDEGASWTLVTSRLPEIYSVELADTDIR